MQLFPPSSAEEDLVSVLDLDNAAVGRGDPKITDHASPTRDAPTTLIISLNDVKGFRRTASDRTRQNRKMLSDHVGMMVEPNGFEPMTSCLQSRRSTN